MAKRIEDRKISMATGLMMIEEAIRPGNVVTVEAVREAVNRAESMLAPVAYNRGEVIEEVCRRRQAQ